VFNNITQSGMAEIAKGDAWNIASHMPPDTNNFGRKQNAILLLNKMSICDIMDNWCIPEATGQADLVSKTKAVSTAS
jgi:hypothetical protein